jgi:Protein of unknown function (DUF2934).
MSNSMHQMTQDIQTRIRELAYMMWESAGRHQGMAMDYWLAAEKEVMSTFQAAAGMWLPATNPTHSPVADVPSQPQSSASPKAATRAAIAEEGIPAVAPAVKTKPTTTKATSRRSTSRSTSSSRSKTSV